jgi:hypothetical protein
LLDKHGHRRVGERKLILPAVRHQLDSAAALPYCGNLSTIGATSVPSESCRGCPVMGGAPRSRSISSR